jgi:hypothetical protein
MVTTDVSTRERIAALLDGLPDEALKDIVTFLEFQHHKLAKHQAEAKPKPRYRPTPMGGLWKGANITEEDIAQARREMWGNFGEEL